MSRISSLPSVSRHGSAAYSSPVVVRSFGGSGWACSVAISVEEARDLIEQRTHAASRGDGDNPGGDHASRHSPANGGGTTGGPYTHDRTGDGVGSRYRDAQ